MTKLEQAKEVERLVMEGRTKTIKEAIKFITDSMAQIHGIDKSQIMEGLNDK